MRETEQRSQERLGRSLGLGKGIQDCASLKCAGRFSYFGHCMAFTATETNETKANMYMSSITDTKIATVTDFETKHQVGDLCPGLCLNK